MTPETASTTTIAPSATRSAPRASWMKLPKPGRIEHVDLVFVPLAEGELRGNGDFAFDFVFVVIGRGVAVVHAAETIGCTGIEEYCRNQRSLAASSVTDYADITNILAFVDVHKCLPRVEFEYRNLAHSSLKTHTLGPFIGGKEHKKHRPETQKAQDLR